MVPMVDFVRLIWRSETTCLFDVVHDDVDVGDGLNISSRGRTRSLFLSS